MDPLTIGLLAGGAYLLFKGSTQAAPAPSGVMPIQPAVIPSAPTSIIQYSGQVDAPRGDGSVSASPIEQTGFIPPYIAAAGPSAVALGGLYGCGCASCLGDLGDARADRQALHTQLKALRTSFRAQIQAAIKAKNHTAVRAITVQMHQQLKALLDAYHAAHPNENKNVTHVAPSVAPHFMAKDRPRRTDVHTGV